MSLEKAFMMLRTRGFISDLSEDLQASIMTSAMRTINVKCDMVVFRPISNPPQHHETETVQYEDEGRTAVYHMRNLQKKVYVKLDDFGDPSQWNEMYEPQIVEELRKAPNCRYTITFMLAEEY